ncbi:alginate O-acetylation protein algI [Brachyspira hampsonii 30446]|uniref:Alginate O-acetylation protein algI n=1 Tax=Brachyspira hampsonii 30446 TaxID=1289135 RepID=A0A2U4FI26_9SPIR|nr:MBOAT family O-acyltransferase [Brachyspira hampsonii]EKV56861.1 alginate O-acetylation protein algI [Brachyspira hampsonii 30446]MBW5395153.1 MBOAT family protein [Brachyspira hampsonii]
MLFSSMIFLWLFLPVVFILYYVIDKRFRNVLLLIASIIFYAWGGVSYTLIMFSSIIINYFFALLIDKAIEENDKSKKKIYLSLCVIVNLSILGYFKYTDFAISIINSISGKEVISLKNIVLPIGISFYTFQALSYVIDVYREHNKAQKNIINLALYISFFPQLIAGPIVKYHDIDSQITNRTESLENISYGIKRFIYGLSKKVILANMFALSCDEILKQPIGDIGTALAWVAAILYTLQIYYDFSGYSDMAIGLGYMFGFKFLENFNYPYISKSVQDFWRRWHISLSTWFKEYLYIPLGGNRRGKYFTYLNLLIVFFATGLWHGASFNFILWGLWHGLFLVIERIFLGRLLEKNKLKFINHIYVILVFVLGWVLFRANDLSHALDLYKLMFSYHESPYTVRYFFYPQTQVCFIFGILFSGIFQSLFPKIREAVFSSRVYILESIIQFILLFICIMYLVNGTYNPFIYFRF